MATKNPRINVSFGADEIANINILAKLEGLSLSGLVKKLALEAMDLREDFVLSRISDKRIKKNKGKKTIPQEQVWKNFGV